MAGERKGSHFLGYSGEQISSGDDGMGPVAQRIRARGYEPRCRGFESLLAHNRSKGEGPFPLGVEKSLYNNPKIAIEKESRNCNRKEKERFAMIFQSFILDNLVSLCMKIINSIVVVGLYYGFLTTFSIGPSYLFLLRARVMEEGTEKKVSATTGFITGQLMMFISIYYVPLHLALGRPHTITAIALPYLLFQFFGNNHKKFLNYGYKNPNSIRNFSIQRIFFKNLIFQLLNPFFLPSSILIRLVYKRN
ncbi:uncharacterized protein LOC113866509 [Abrus precatorius]|uniref:Uncharacterized protein LOC113866509 n=1 Tax=Abrus precatorius TaxID=3816 RepID=A0A8B8LQH7_ABRPR|nr:uncharacterized protein LOC113866509 [Abrus precatorius]